MTTALAAVPVIWVLAGATVDAADGLELSFDNGTVTLVASEVPVSDILSEWARIGSTRFVDAEDLADGSPLTLQLTDVPEAEALELLLRAAAGYLAAPRAVRVDGASRFDRVLIMATSSGPQPTSGAPPMTPSFGGPTAGTPDFAPTPGFSFVPGGGGFDPGGQDPAFEAGQSEQLQQLQELLQQPAFPDGAFGEPQFAAPDVGGPQPGAEPQTSPRPGVIINAPEQTPNGRRSPMATVPVRPQTGDPE